MLSSIGNWMISSLFPVAWLQRQSTYTKSCWSCKEGTLHFGLWISHHSAGYCTKVSSSCLLYVDDKRQRKEQTIKKVATKTMCWGKYFGLKEVTGEWRKLLDDSQFVLITYYLGWLNQERWNGWDVACMRITKNAHKVLVYLFFFLIVIHPESTSPFHSVSQGIIYWVVPRIWKTDRYDCPSLKSVGQSRCRLWSFHSHTL